MQQCRHLFLLLILSFSSCGYAAGNNPDPLEPFNRKMFNFNKFLDKFFLKPAAKLYTKATPKIIKTGVNNALSNLDETRNFANNLLQLKYTEASRSLIRFGYNTTLGIGGIFDVAGTLGVERGEEQNFGQTLAYWGWDNSMYLVVPLIGPSTVRDTLGLAIDKTIHPANYLNTPGATKNQFFKSTIFKLASPKQWSYAQALLETLEVRVSIMEFEDAATSLAFDEYEFYKNAYLQSWGAYRGSPFDDLEEDLFFEEDF